MICPTPTDCFALAGNLPYAEALRSTDGGKKWDILKIDLIQQEGYLMLTCPIAQNCFLAPAVGKIQTTNDGGQTWHEQISPSAKGFRSFSCATATDCLALAWSYDISVDEE